MPTEGVEAKVPPRLRTVAAALYRLLLATVVVQWILELDAGTKLCEVLLSTLFLAMAIMARVLLAAMGYRRVLT